MSPTVQKSEPNAHMSSHRSDRMRKILSLLQERDSASLRILSNEFRVSLATIRRDLANLDEQGLLLRTHGGARVLDVTTEIPVRFRDLQFRESKQKIALQVMTMIPTGPYAVAISGGTTTAEVARTLGTRRDLTIVTNSLSIALECAARPRLKVIITGGVVRRSSFEAVGSLSESTFHAVNVGTAILGTDGISAVGGATTHDETEARTNGAMVSAAQRVIVVADGSKVGRTALAQMAKLDQISDLVTDAAADPHELRLISAAGVRVHQV